LHSRDSAPAGMYRQAMTHAQINHVSIGAQNLQDSVQFYAEIFGAQLIDTPNFGFPVQWLRIGDCQLHLFERPAPARPTTISQCGSTTSRLFSGRHVIEGFTTPIRWVPTLMSCRVARFSSTFAIQAAISLRLTRLMLGRSATRSGGSWFDWKTESRRTTRIGELSFTCRCECQPERRQCSTEGRSQHSCMWRQPSRRGAARPVPQWLPSHRHVSARPPVRCSSSCSNPAEKRFKSGRGAGCVRTFELNRSFPPYLREMSQNSGP
jgi:hypothetical protein